MTVHFPKQRSRSLSTVAIAVLVAAVGCRQSEQIHSYTVPKETKPVAAAPKPAGEPTDRMLAAILPVGDQAWFFKVVGPIAAIDAHEKVLNDFFSKLTAGSDGRAKWELPAGWTEEPGSAMRIATIRIPADGKPLELSVTALPWSGNSEAMLQNVNRWRGQMQLPPTTVQKLATDTHDLKAGDKTLTIVDLRGQFQSGGMTPPFAGPVGAASRAAPDTASNLPEGHPPIDASAKPQNGPPANEPPPAAVPQFTAPQSWREVAPEGIRRAAFAVADGPKAASVTVFDFPSNSGPMMTDPLFNINRWRTQIGLPEIDKKDLSTTTESMQVGGVPATYAAMIPDAAKPEQSQAAQATLAAMVTNGDRIWFFKMTGDRELVAARQDEFKAFLKSVKFADGGTPNGNK